MGNAAVSEAEVAGPAETDYRRLMWFTGRMRRRSFWLLSFALGAINLIISSFSLLFPSTENDSGFQLLVFTTAVGLIAGWLAFTSFIRRLHDIGLSGSWVLLPGLINGASRLSGVQDSRWIIGTMATTALLIALLDGTQGKNRFGTDPRGRKPSSAEAGLFPEFIRRVDRWTISGPLLACLLAVLANSLADPAVQLLPRSWMLSVGEAEVAAQVPSIYLCPVPNTRAALERLAVRLDPALPVRIVFTSHPYVNGLAVPGGIVLIGQDVLRLAQSPEEVAGLMAHELAHVRLRHTEQMFLTTLPQALLPPMLGTLNAGLTMSYSRTKEREADALAVRTLVRAGIDPRQFAILLTRLDRERQQKQRRRGGDVPSWLSTHPSTPERIVTIDQTSPAAYRQPAMTREDWAAIHNGCNRSIQANLSVRSR